MPVIDEDELGPWMDLGRSAIRPAGPTRFKLGEKLDEFHFGGSTLHGVGKVAGMRGGYQEAWISGPKSRILHEKETWRAGWKGGADYDFACACFIKDLAVLRRGSPGFEPQAPVQSMMKIKIRREAYLASVGYTLGLLKLEPKLMLEGHSIHGEVLARWEAGKLSEAAGSPVAAAKGKMRM